jgi:hypothetical protein
VEVPVRLKTGSGQGANATFFEGSGEKGAGGSGSGSGDGEPPEFFAGGASAETSGSGGDPLVWYITSGGLAAGTIGAAIWTAERSGQLSDCEDTDTYHCENEETVLRERNLAALTTIVLGAGAIGALVYGLMVDADNSAEAQEDDPEQEARALSCGPTLMGARCAMRF